ncbi:MAG TPA: glycoside hydrolase family 9 protein [Fimbriimonas sp.]|nr:glycoside hydrolase family 9 protein [Fimbriimonas sp.]
MEAYAAIHLFALTGDAKYQQSIIKKVGASRQLSDAIWSPYEAGSSESLVDYLSVPGADPDVCRRIKDQLTRSATDAHFAPPADADLYRAWMEPTNYHWGSNTVRANWGVVALLAADHADVDAATKARLRQRAADMLHSFHGVNPLSVVYLTNMGKYGAEHSLQTIYHARYGAGTPFSENPPPGYVVGGPNQSFSGKAAAGKPSIEWIRKQPRAKAYADFNLNWPESSWELSEPAIYYQAAYVRLLAPFVK